MDKDTFSVGQPLLGRMAKRLYRQEALRMSRVQLVPDNLAHASKFLEVHLDP